VGGFLGLTGRVRTQLNPSRLVGADMLLGLGVLAQVSPKFAINVATSTLDFH
jgi:hypothetical protein